MLPRMLDQQDKYFFPDNKRLTSSLEWIRRHAHELRTFASEARKMAKLPPACVELLRAGGLFDLALPLEAGGLGLDSAEQARVVEEIAVTDASIAWCVMIGMDSGIYRGFFDECTAASLFSSAGLITAGWIHPQGTAVDLGDETCLVNGRWQFGSGINHADMILGGVRLFTSGEEVNDSWRIAVLDKADVLIEDSWKTWGLQGSGSQHYRASEMIIPLSHLFSLHQSVKAGPLYRPHDAILRKMVGVPIGVAIGALATTFDHLAAKTPLSGPHPPRPNERVLSTVGRLTAELLSTRAAIYSSLQAAWTIYSDESEVKKEIDAARVATAVTRQHAFETARSLVMRAGDLLGAHAVYTDAGDLGGRLSDLHVMNQHAVAQQALLDTAGYRVLGGTTTGPFL